MEDQGNIGYCESCGKRITGDDFGFGDAVRRNNRIYCADCARTAAADTGLLPSPDTQAQGLVQKRPPSTRSLPAQHRRSSHMHRKHSSSHRLAAQVRNAAVQKIAASITCPYCGEKLVVVIAALPCNHTCELCGKLMRVPAPGGTR